jgi:hypothetical protein
VTNDRRLAPTAPVAAILLAGCGINSIGGVSRMRTRLSRLESAPLGQPPNGSLASSRHYCGKSAIAFRCRRSGPKTAFPKADGRLLIRIESRRSLRMSVPSGKWLLAQCPLINAMVIRSVLSVTFMSVVASCAIPHPNFDRLSDKALWEATYAYSSNSANGRQDAS